MHDRRKDCGLCLSTIAEDIVLGKKQGVPTPKLFKRYVSATGYKGNSRAFYMMLYRHMTNGHQKTLIPQTPQSTEPMSLEEYSNRLTQAVANDPEMWKGKKISHQAVIAAKRALIEQEKVKVQNDAMKNAFIAFFRGQGVKLPDGMVIDGDELLQSNTE